MDQTRALMQCRGISFADARRELGKRGVEAKQRKFKLFQQRMEREERQGLR
jgi:hypothetical protein